MELSRRMASVFQKTFGLDPTNFTLDLAPESVSNWDSIGHMNLVAGLEQEFDVQFEVDEIMEMSSPQKIVDILQARGISG